MNNLEIIHCGTDYTPSVLDIFNEAILNSTALYEYEARTLEDIQRWFDIKSLNNFPVIGIIDEQSKLLGFGSYGIFRAFPAFHYTIEHSIYIHKDYRGKGLGRQLLQALIENAISQNYHCMIAGIDSLNEGSIKLHKSMGFEFSGQIKHAGYKFSNWLDLNFYQLILPSPTIATETHKS